MIKLVIKGNPIPKKNSMQIARNGNRVFVRQSDRYLAYEREAVRQITDLQGVKPEKPIEEACNVKMTFYRDSYRRIDLVNLEESILDILVKAGILADDNFNVVRAMDGSRVFVDKENPRCEIEVQLGTCEENSPRCYFCGGQMIWQSDFNYDEVHMEGDGIVSYWRCSEYGADTEWSLREDG